jgi:TetR/AcrR family transcriptional regulator, mexJK operon transcriptional repressor
MAQVAAAVGGSKATLYNHFNSKEELLLAVVEDVTRPPTEDTLQGPQPKDFREWLTWLGRVSVSVLASYEIVALRRLANSEAMRLPEVGRVFYETGVMSGHKRIAAVFEDAMERGVLRRSDPLTAVEHFLELCSGWLIRKIDWNIAPMPSEAEINRHVDAAVETFLNGYGPRIPQPKKIRK